MALWNPHRPWYGSAVSGRERGLVAGYNFVRQENEIINLEPSGALGANLDISTPAGAHQVIDRMLGRGIRTIPGEPSIGAAAFAGTGTELEGTFAFTVRPWSLPIDSNSYRLLHSTNAPNRWHPDFEDGVLRARMGTNAATINTTYTGIEGKSVRVAIRWSGTLATYQIFADGQLVGDEVAVFSAVDPMTQLFVLCSSAAGTNCLDGEMYDLVVSNQRWTDEEVQADYLKYAKRVQWYETLDGAFVSSADQTIRAIENTIWVPYAVNGQAFRVVDAALPFNQNAKALRGEANNSEFYGMNQHLGLKADDPEAAYGTWEWWFFKKDGSSGVEVDFVKSTPNRSSMDGYGINHDGNESLNLYRRTGGVVIATVINAGVGAVPAEEWFKVTVTREQTEGNFEVFVNDVSVGTGTDNTHKAGSYFGGVLDNGDEITHISKQLGVAA